MSAQILIQLKIQGETFPSTGELEKRDALLDALESQSSLRVVGIGSGGGVMDIRLEAKQAKRAVRRIWRLLTMHQLEAIASVQIEESLQQPAIPVQLGDLFYVRLDEGLIAVGIVLHLSTIFVDCMLVGFYDLSFPAFEHIHIEQLGGHFLITPNYTHTQAIMGGNWPKLGCHPALLESAEIPALRAAYTVYLKDEIVGQLHSLEEFSQYTELAVAGQIFVENRLRQYFRRQRAADDVPCG